MKRQLKILHCIPALGGGGAEQQLANLLVEANNPNIEHAVVAWRSGKHAAAIRNAGKTIFILNEAKRSPLRLIFGFCQVLKEWRPTLLHAWLPQSEVLFSPFGRLFGIPVIGSERNNSFIYTSTEVSRMWFTRLRPFVWRCFIRGAISNSLPGKDYLQDELRAKGPIAVIENGIDLERIISMPAIDRKEFNIPIDVPVIVTASRLVDHKRVDILIKALALIRARNNRIHLVIIGDGPSKGSLLDLVKKLGLEDWVSVLGYREDVISVFKAADIFCSASEVEGIPNSLLEAISVGLPVLTSNIAGHRTVMERKEIGWMFETGSDHALADKIEKLINSTDQMAAFSQNARLLAQEFSLSSMCKQFENFYQAYVGQSGS